MAACASPMNIYQLKITLEKYKPPIWRRIQISKYSTFKQLHQAIVSCMPWKDCHLHVFRTPFRRGNFEDENEEIEIATIDEYSNNFEMFGVKRLDEAKTKLCDYFKNPKDLIQYEYDFGASWTHEITLEKILPFDAGQIYPICIAGRRACPPEDITESDSDEEWQSKGFDPKSVTFSEGDK